MQPRPAPRGEHHVVRVALALQPGRPDLVLAVGGGEFGEPEADRQVELGRLPDVVRRDLEMVEPHRARALVELEPLQVGRQVVHGGAEFERRADRIVDVQRAALIGPLGPLRLEAGQAEVLEGAVEIVLGEHAQADALAHRRLVGLAEHQAVVRALLQRAQIERVLVAVAGDQAQHVAIERLRLVEIARGHHRVAGARHVEGRGEIGFKHAAAYSFGGSPASVRRPAAPPRRRWRSPAGSCPPRARRRSP